MAIVDCQAVKSALNITDASQDGWLTNLANAADAVIRNYCKRQFETALYTEYPRVGNTPEAFLKQRPVQLYTVQGTLTASSATVTGLSDTSNLRAGLACAVQTVPPAGQTYLPAPSVVSTVSSGTTVTLSNPANISGTVTLLFGPAVYWDAQGYGGQGVGAFGPATQLLLGTDYMLDVDQPDGSSVCGVLRRLAGVSAPLGFLGFGWPWAWNTGRNTLTAQALPAWPRWYSCLKVVYLAGYGTGPSQMPADLVHAGCRLVAWMQRTVPDGADLGSETLGKYTYQLRNYQPGEAREVGEVRQILARYVEVAI